MKITKHDLERWKENTLALASGLSLDKDILSMLEECSVEVLPGNSGANLYGWAWYEPPKVEVYETNPSRHFPRAFQEVWNQSGMDHELIGHIYNFYAGLGHSEPDARKTQVEIARHRGEDGFLWKLATLAEPAVRNLQRYRNRMFYGKSIAI